MVYKVSFYGGEDVSNVNINCKEFEQVDCDTVMVNGAKIVFEGPIIAVESKEVIE
jgi:hypothetical protein